MNREAVSMNAGAGEELAVALADLGHLFNTPRIDALSGSPSEVLGVSGVDHMLSLLYMDLS